MSGIQREGLVLQELKKRKFSENFEINISFTRLDSVTAWWIHFFKLLYKWDNWFVETIHSMDYFAF